MPESEEHPCGCHSELGEDLKHRLKGRSQVSVTEVFSKVQQDSNSTHCTFLISGNYYVTELYVSFFSPVEDGCDDNKVTFTEYQVLSLQGL